MAERLKADCSRCFGLCCVAPAFARSSDFAIDKPAGRECPNLGDGFGCGIHVSLRERGFAGCTVYDCFGAGQQVAQVTFGGRDWRTEPSSAASMFAAFTVMRQLHELLWYLGEARSLPVPATLAAALDAALADTDALTSLDAVALAAVDVEAHRQRCVPLLREASEVARAGYRAAPLPPDLMGANLRGADLRGAALRGALLVGADLRRADLRAADVIGADLRGADVRGARLDGTLFLIQSQLDASRGDAATTIPARLTRPAHWAPSGAAPPGRTPGKRTARRR
ncbi:pentapeptide repeat-containing protein [Dactylosporangium sp. AC04546]|uniref:pentapeptide repeat-containing protein n=1 Tax=Dactylosporangium sp. AC04546 TaxID=2862460 RepID=UPI001EDE5421|nr:pentapeptide repeat-containing protein [Dactylosporangium sp. AC04546]WVK89394.1 pentapeptide repeat-containing protein [Dactylosporangium sp. AC04546]